MRAITRRTLLGGGAVAAVGAGALVVGETGRGRRWLHAAGIIDGPDQRPPDIDVPVSQHRLDSRRMGRDVGWTIAAPVGADPEAVIVCLHGRGESAGFAFDAIGVHRFVAGEMLPWAVVGVDGGDSSYWHARADGTDAESMLVEELLPAVSKVAGKTPVVLLGWSMGGYGALLAASDHHDRIAAVAAGSPALWPSFAQAAPGAFDDDADFLRHDLLARVDRLGELPVRIDCGDDDPFIGMARELARKVPHAEHAFGTGFHDVGFWRSRVRSQLAFFRRVLAA
jgi:pimeloyl-ACP methyl ester carboxylesterase